MGLFGLQNPFGTDRVDRSQPALLRSIEDVSEYRPQAAAEESELTEQARADTETFLTGLGRSLGVELTFVDG